MKRDLERTEEQVNISSSPPEYLESVAPAISEPPAPETADEPKQDLPINVLVIGETQNGKSTMIRQMGVYAGVPDINVKIGFGMGKPLQPRDAFCNAEYNR